MSKNSIFKVRIRFWALLIVAFLLILLRTCIGLAILGASLFLLYFVLTNVNQVPFNEAYNMILVGIMAIFLVWLAAWPILKGIPRLWISFLSILKALKSGETDKVVLPR